MYTKSQLEQIIKECNFHPRKSLGQSFLIDKNIKQKIIDALALTKKDVVLEIGPGFGALTGDLCKKAKKVYAVEKDKRLCNFLKNRFYDCQNLIIINQDILKFDFKRYCLDSKLKAVGNLPYYITSPIITYLIHQKYFLTSIFITLQVEVAKRIIAKPNAKDYSRLTVFVSFSTKPQILFPIKKSAFFPQSGVDSCLIELDILSQPSVKVKNEKVFLETVKASFGNRRKAILNALLNSSLIDLSKDELLKILEQANIDPVRRGETFSLDEFGRLSNLLCTNLMFTAQQSS